MNTYLWETEGLTKIFYKKNFMGKTVQSVRALNNVSLFQEKGETLGIVGESGCGKSTFGRTLMGLYPKTKGKIYFKGQTVTETEAYRQLRHSMQMVFQDPYASLNPRLKVSQIVGEALDIEGSFTHKEREDRVYEVLNLVGLRNEHSQRYPHEFSGGQRQRIGIARALITNPECIICDEPISALDISIQVQIITLLEKLQKTKNLSYIFISHDLSMVRYLSQRIAVMYLGSVVETGPAELIYENPVHPYTQGLMAATGTVTPRAPIRSLIKGELPSPLNPPPGCPFATRCPIKDNYCDETLPELRNIEGRQVACLKR